ncbi:hypothetical protein [Xenorhabdus bovienii]|uniref:hypothetical protein n=1 Tax=Xenorhabdus bovienii TaxID=40576 RepID=UPI00237D00E7|nr:hypothetical protein [Xenorhabdus bovienii]MDE1490528.1 hypothetical protein [Xenorhabdus bovienii]
MDAFIWADRDDGKDGRPCRASAALGRAGCIDQGVEGKQQKTNTTRLSEDNRRRVRR